MSESFAVGLLRLPFREHLVMADHLVRRIRDAQTDGASCAANKPAVREIQVKMDPMRRVRLIRFMCSPPLVGR